MPTDFDAEAFAALADRLRDAPTPELTADEVVMYARHDLEADYAGITLFRRDRQLETIAPSHDIVEQADQLEYDLGEGPCWDSVWKGDNWTCQDLRVDDRWPRWAQKVADLGIHGALAIELADTHKRRLGAVNLYWKQPRAFTTDELATASVFARHAALALAKSIEVEQLHTALDTRKCIGQAQGIAMERYSLDEERAFELLRRYSQDYNVKLRDVARQFVQTRKLPGSHQA